MRSRNQPELPNMRSLKKIGQEKMTSPNQQSYKNEIPKSTRTSENEIPRSIRATEHNISLINQIYKKPARKVCLNEMVQFCYQVRLSEAVNFETSSPTYTSTLVTLTHHLSCTFADIIQAYLTTEKHSVI